MGLRAIKMAILEKNVILRAELANVVKNWNHVTMMKYVHLEAARP